MGYFFNSNFSVRLIIMFTYMNCQSQLLANFIGIIYFFLFLGAGRTELFRFYSSVETVYLLEFIFAYSMRQGSG